MVLYFIENLIAVLLSGICIEDKTRFVESLYGAFDNSGLSVYEDFLSRRTLMKHFITFMTQQNRLDDKDYKNVDNVERLENDFKTSFPILIPMSNTCSEGEKVKITVINTNDPNGNGKKNYQKFLSQLEERAKIVGFSYQIKDIEVEFEENSAKQMKLFEDIIDTFEENDVIIGDITYGNKPSPIVLLMALSYADRFCKNTFVDMLVYGGVSHGEVENCFISDVTSLFYMNSIINRLSFMEPSDPLSTIKKMIKR